MWPSWNENQIQEEGYPKLDCSLQSCLPVLSAVSVTHCQRQHTLSPSNWIMIGLLYIATELLVLHDPQSS